MIGDGIGEEGAEEGETEVEKLNRLLKEKTVESRRRQDVEREARERRREERRERLGFGVGAKQSMRNVDPEMIQVCSEREKEKEKEKGRERERERQEDPSLQM